MVSPKQESGRTVSLSRNIRDEELASRHSSVAMRMEGGTKRRWRRKEFERKRQSIDAKNYMETD